MKTTTSTIGNRIMKALFDANGPMTGDELFAALGGKDHRPSVMVAASKLRKDGMVSRPAKGVYAPLFPRTETPKPGAMPEQPAAWWDNATRRYPAFEPVAVRIQQLSEVMLDVIAELENLAKYDIRKVSNDALMDELANRLDKRVLRSMVDTMKDNEPPEHVEHRQPKVKPLVIVIIGIKGSQTANILAGDGVAQRISRGTLDLRFIEVRGGHLQLPHADEVITFTSMISRKHQEQIEAKYPGKIHTARGIVAIVSHIVRLSEQWEKTHGVPPIKVFYKIDEKLR